MQELGGQGISTEPYNRFSNYSRSVRALRRPQHTVRRAGTKILMHRNYPNYHVNGILRAPALCFRPLAAPCDSDLCTRLQPADRRVRTRGCRHSSFRAETHTRAHMRPLHEFRGRTVARTLPTRIHESNCFIYEQIQSLLNRRRRRAGASRIATAHRKIISATLADHRHRRLLLTVLILTQFAVDASTLRDYG